MHKDAVTSISTRGGSKRISEKKYKKLLYSTFNTILY